MMFLIKIYQKNLLEENKKMNKIATIIREYPNMWIDNTMNYIVDKYNPSKSEYDIVMQNFKKIYNTFSEFEKGIKKNILLYGAVQSGKTKYLLAISQLALESNYTFVIYISGNKNNLHEQNLRDFQKKFKGTKVKNLEFIAHTSKNLDLRNHKYWKNKKVILFVKKIAKDINELESLIDQSNFNKYKFLVIDDECDNATPNVSSSDKLSLINKVISKLAKKNNVNYIGTTGTPYPSLLMKGDPKIEKVLILNNPKNYRGLEYFKNNDFYKIIDLKEKGLDNLIKGFLLEYINDSVSTKIISNPQVIINISHKEKDIEQICKNVKVTLKQLQSDFYLKNQKEHIEFINKIKINKLNNKFKKTFSTSHPSINIGCFMISRGFRFDFLTHVLILTKITKNLSLDTFVQRCRWFGYQTWDVKIWTNIELFVLYTKIAPIVDREIKKIFLEDENISQNTIERIKGILLKHNINNIGTYTSKRN